MNVLYSLGGLLVGSGITALSMGVQHSYVPGPTFAVILGTIIIILTVANDDKR